MPADSSSVELGAFADVAKGTTVIDCDGNGVVNSTEISAFINAYFAAEPECLG